MICEECGVSKPDKGIFEIACQKMGVKAEECIYVGDTFGNDILGAYNAGMIPIWLWPLGKERPMRCEEITRIDKLSDLIEILM